MRSRMVDLQDVWVCNFEERNISLDRVKIYGKPRKIRASVSATSGSVLGFGAGMSLQYDRYFTVFKDQHKNYDGTIEEGNMCFIDVDPVLDEDGFLVVEEVEDESGAKFPQYTTPPDYMIQKILDTKRGEVVRYVIKKV